MPNYHGHIEISRAFLDIDEKLTSMKEFVPRSAYDMQIQALFTQYMVVFITRTIEGSVKNIILTKCKILGKSQIEIKDIKKKLKDFQTPSKENIFLYYKDILNINLNNSDFTNDHFTALGQIVENRHLIAHSDDLLETIQYLKTLDDVEKHYNEIQNFISKLCEITTSN